MQTFYQQDRQYAADRMQLFLREKEVAIRLAVSEKWLQKMRYQGGGIPFHKFGGAVRYAVADIEVFEAANRMASTSSPQHPLYTHSQLNNGETGQLANHGSDVRGSQSRQSEGGNQ